MGRRTLGGTIYMAQKFLHYDVLERLGEGARSTIYLVQDPVTRQAFALKHVVRTDPKDLRFIEQMETEYEISRQFNHPNLRRSYELKIIKTMLVKVSEAFLVMELVDGKPLDVQPPREMLDICDTFIQAAEGLRRCTRWDMHIATSSPTTFCATTKAW